MTDALWPLFNVKSLVTLNRRMDNFLIGYRVANLRDCPFEISQLPSSIVLNVQIISVILLILS